MSELQKSYRLSIQKATLKTGRNWTKKSTRFCLADVDVALHEILRVGSHEDEVFACESFESIRERSKRCGWGFDINRSLSLRTARRLAFLLDDMDLHHHVANPPEGRTYALFASVRSHNVTEVFIEGAFGVPPTTQGALFAYQEPCRIVFEGDRRVYGDARSILVDFEPHREHVGERFRMLYG